MPSQSNWSGRGDRTPNLALVKIADRHQQNSGSGGDPKRRAGAAGRDLDWSILMARTQAGDRAAYRRLLTDLAPYLRALAARRGIALDEIEDAVQDILLALHAVRQTYDPARPFGPWIVTIANGRLVDRRRRMGRRRARETPLAPEHETFPAAGAKLLDEAVADRRDLERAIAGLSDGQQQAIRLLKLEEMSLKEAAAQTGLSITALKVATHRAVHNLRKALSARRG